MIFLYDIEDAWSEYPAINIKIILPSLFQNFLPMFLTVPFLNEIIKTMPDVKSKSWGNKTIHVI